MESYTSLAAMLASLRQQELLAEARRMRAAGRISHRARRTGLVGELATLPLLTKVGTALVVLGLIADLVPGATAVLGAHLGHLVVLPGMVLVLAGIVIQGFRIHLTTAKEGLSHAIR